MGSRKADTPFAHPRLGVAALKETWDPSALSDPPRRHRRAAYLKPLLEAEVNRVEAFLFGVVVGAVIMACFWAANILGWWAP